MMKKTRSNKIYVKNIDKGLINTLGYTPTYNHYKNGELVVG